MLAVVAASQGARRCDLDSCGYARSIGQKQIYGTQFQTRASGTTQEPYDRGLISDDLRVALGVGTQAQQEKQRMSFVKGAKL